MPQIIVHSLFDAFVNFTIASPRPEAVPSYIIPNADLHDELAAKLRGALREYKHLSENSDWVASAKQVATYLPATSNVGTFYAVRSFDPAGSLVEVDEGFMLDVLKLRYSLVFAVLPGALLADERTGEAYERHWQKAFKDLLVTGYGFDGVFIPGDDTSRDDNKTTIDIQLELGAAKASMGFEKSAG